MSSGGHLSDGRGPGLAFVVKAVVAQTGVQASDQFVGDDTQSLVVQLAAPAQLVVAVTSAGRAIDGRRGPQKGGIGQTPVADHPAPHFAVFAGGPGDRDVADIAAACRSIGIAGWIVARLAQNPAAEDVCQPGKAAVDLGVRVPSKSRRQPASKPKTSARAWLSMRTSEATSSPYAAITCGLPRSKWGARSTAWISSARRARLRCRPCRRSAASSWRTDSRRPRSGSGATASTARASPSSSAVSRCAAAG